MICAGAQSIHDAPFSCFTSKIIFHKQLVSSLSNAVTFIRRPVSVSKNLLPPSSRLGIPCGKDGLLEQPMRLCKRTNGRL